MVSDSGCDKDLQDISPSRRKVKYFNNSLIIPVISSFEWQIGRNPDEPWLAAEILPQWPGLKHNDAVERPALHIYRESTLAAESARDQRYDVEVQSREDTNSKQC